MRAHPLEQKRTEGGEYLDVVLFSEKKVKQNKIKISKKKKIKRKGETGGSENELKQTLDFFEVAWFCFRPNVNV